MVHGGGVNRHHRTLALVALPLALLACSKKPASPQDLESLDHELTDDAATGNSRDPALTAALHDQIMVDPSLAQSSNATVVRPPNRPDSGAVPPDDVAAKAVKVDAGPVTPAPAAKGDCPNCTTAKTALTLGALASRQADKRTANCAPNIAYSAGWATRLPAELPLYPDARVVEAAGADGPACALRIVSFSSSAAPGAVIDWYYTRATKAGYNAEHQADGIRHTLGGTRGNSAYMIYVTARGAGGSSVDLISNAGR